MRELITFASVLVMVEAHLSNLIWQWLTHVVCKVLNRALIEVIRLHVEVAASLHGVICQPYHVLSSEKSPRGFVKFFLVIVA